jgi:serine/threonine protein kinase
MMHPMPETSQPRAFGDYVVDRELGRGGMGVVYAATHAALGKRVAVKVLLADVSRDAELLERFQNEARAASAIEHPSIVEIHTVGHEGDAVYIVMELLQGESLAARLRSRGAMSVGDAIGLARQCANALDAAHRVGIVHRDLKPDNVFLVPDIEVAGGERVKLLDFGIAKLVGAETSSSVARTVTGAILGTPHYMSPEQCEGAREVDARSDLYSLGCMLFQMVTGRLPFISAGIGGLIGMHLHVAPPTLRSIRPDVPPALDELIGRLLAKSPEERIQSAGEVAAALKSISPRSSQATLPPPPAIIDPTMATVSTVVADRPPPTRSRRGLAIAGGGIAIAAVVAGFVLARGEEDPVPNNPIAVPITPASPPSTPIAIEPIQPLESKPPPNVALDGARGMLADGNLPGVEYQLALLLAKSPDDPAVLALQADVGRAKATRTIEGMRKAAAAKRYTEVKQGAERVPTLTADPALVATATTLWADVKADATAAVKAQVIAAVEKRDCKAAAAAAKLGRALGETYDQLLTACAARTRSAADDELYIKWLVNEIHTSSAGHHIAMQCNTLIRKDPTLVPWARCVQAACGFDAYIAEAMIVRAPSGMRMALEASCPQLKTKR